MFKLVLAFLAVLVSVAILPSFVLADTMMMDSGEMMGEMHMGPMVFDRMLHAWISLAAAIVVFILALKFMVGGALSRPIMLMGFGALADAMIGLFPSHGGHMENMWLGSLLFSLSVVVGIIWMAKIFGAFQVKK